jgi:lactoylglutathione lyase
MTKGDLAIAAMEFLPRYDPPRFLTLFCFTGMRRKSSVSPERQARHKAVPAERAFSERRQRDQAMRYLHTMVRVSDLEAALDFYCAKLGLKEVRRVANEKGRFTLVFLASPEDEAQRPGESPMVELTWNWDEKGYSGGRNFGHLAYAVKDVYALCGKLQKAGVTINRPPRDGHMAFIRSPDGISIELLQEGNPLPPQEPWASMPNSGSW